MDIIEKIGDTITEKGKVAADKAKELAAIAICRSLLLRSSVKPLRIVSVPLQICRRKSIS